MPDFGSCAAVGIASRFPARGRPTKKRPDPRVRPVCIGTLHRGGMERKDPKRGEDRSDRVRNLKGGGEEFRTRRCNATRDLYARTALFVVEALFAMEPCTQCIPRRTSTRWIFTQIRHRLRDLFRNAQTTSFFICTAARFPCRNAMENSGENGETGEDGPETGAGPPCSKGAGPPCSKAVPVYRSRFSWVARMTRKSRSTATRIEFFNSRG